MDSITWYKGKMLRRYIDETRSDLRVSHLAVLIILAARDQGLTLEDVVRELIEADQYDAATSKLDREQSLKQLGF